MRLSVSKPASPVVPLLGLCLKTPRHQKPEDGCSLWEWASPLALHSRGAWGNRLGNSGRHARGAWPWRHSSLGSFCEHALRGTERRGFLHPSVPPETFWMQSLDLPRIQEGLLKAYRGMGLSRASLHSYFHDPMEAIPCGVAR